VPISKKSEPIETRTKAKSMFLNGLGSDMELENYLLGLQIYEPFFITNNMIIAFNKKPNVAAEKLSIKDIIGSEHRKNSQKLYFKVTLTDDNIQSGDQNASNFSSGFVSSRFMSRLRPSNGFEEVKEEKDEESSASLLAKIYKLNRKLKKKSRSSLD
jgi:hypothetical protein